MSENEAPLSAPPAAASSSPSGRPDDAVLASLPEKVRVHALARLVGSSSREVLAVLARLEVAARSAQSSVDRATVSHVVDAFFPSEAAAGAPADPVAPASTGGGASAGDDGSGLVTGAIGGAPAAPAALFLAPDVTTPAAEAEGTGRRRRRSSRSTGVVTPDETAEPTTPEVPATAAAPAVPEAEEPDESDTTGPEGQGDADDDDGGRKRRRRGRRGRGRGRGGPDDESGEDSSENADEDSSDAPTSGAPAAEDQSSDDQSSDDQSSDDDEGDDEGDSSDDSTSSGSSRRRRRRRRRTSEDSGDGTTPDDPPNTVTHVREKTEGEPRKRSSDDEVKGVKGSTRLEAKRQRRRDGREQGRRRPAILSESEFLARREAVERTMVVREQADRNQIGVLEDGVLVEHFVAGTGQNSMVGNVYLGRVQNVLPSMEAAFVDIGRGRNAVLYAGEVNWDAAGLDGKQRKIEHALSSGDSVLVQVTKDPVGHKGARLTTQISLPGRFLVYVPGGGATGISRKLPEQERKRLKDILKRIVPSEAGVIIRTAAEGIEEDELEQDVRRLAAQWEVIERTGREAAEGGGGGKGKGSGKGSANKAPTLVHEEPDLLIRVVRDMFNEDFSSLVISGEQAWETLEGYISHVAPELVPRLSRHTGPEDVFHAHRIDEQLVKALDRKVWLPSGGTLVIDRTEAMTVVDVNTGKFTGSGGNLEETVTRNNLEAAEEVVRQLRLRDIGGMIVIDFIDMVLESNRDLVLRRLTECLGRDRTRHQVAEVTSLGLVQMTRKRVGQGLLDEFSTPCEHCKGRGVIIHTDPVTGGPEHAQSGRNGSSSGSGSSGSSSSGSGSASSGSASSGSSGSGSSSAASSGDSGSDDADRNGSGQNGSGQNGSGSGSGRRRGRGRRGASSEGGSPTTVASSVTAVAAPNGMDGPVPTPAELAQRRSAAGVEDAEEPEVALEVEQAEESTGTPEVAETADEADAPDEAVASDEDGPAEESGSADQPAVPVAEEPDQPAMPVAEEPDQPAMPVAEEPGQPAMPVAEEPAAAPAAPGPAAGTPEPTPEPEPVASTPIPASEEPDQPETPAATGDDESAAPAGRRRRRAASRPAGPPVAVGGH